MGATVARVRTLSTRYSMYHRQHTRLMHRTRPQTPQTLRQPTVQEHCASRTPTTRLNCGAVYMQSAPRPLSHPKPSPSPVTCTYAAPLSPKLQPSARRGALRPRCPRRHRCADLGYGAMIGPASGRTVPTTTLPSSPAPVARRSRAGGASSHRCFLAAGPDFHVLSFHALTKA